MQHPVYFVFLDFTKMYNGQSNFTLKIDPDITSATVPDDVLNEMQSYAGRYYLEGGIPGRLMFNSTFQRKFQFLADETTHEMILKLYQSYHNIRLELQEGASELTLTYKMEETRPSATLGASLTLNRTGDRETT